MNCNYETLKQAFDYHHGDTSGNDLGYCVEYTVTFHAPEWSKGQWFNIEGIDSEGTIHDLLQIGYSYQFPWLVAGTYRS